MDIAIRMKFGLPPDPWGAGDQATADAVRVAHAVRAAADAQAMVWIVGARGSGKTQATRRALAACGAPVVEPLRLDRENLHMGDIQSAIVRDLSDETPRQSGEGRSGQVRRVLGGMGRPPVLWVDEAHCLHHRTVAGLKRLRELAWKNRAPLLGIVLSGQREPSRSPEVALRTAMLRMQGLAADEAEAALLRVLGEAIRPDAAKRLARTGAAGNWLDLQEAADACLRLADVRGLDAVDEAVVEAAFAPEEPAARRPAASASPRPGAVASRLREAS